MSLDEDKHATCGFRSIEGITPGVIDEVSELGQDCGKYIMNMQ